MDVVPDAALIAARAAAQPWLWPLAGLSIWNKVWRGMEEKLSDVEATTIWGLWKNRNGQNKIPEDVGFAKTNALVAS